MVKIAKSKKKAQPFGSCPYCWQMHEWETFNYDELCPDIIFVVEHIGQIQGREGRFLRDFAKKQGVKCTIIPANACGEYYPKLEELKRNRELVLLPFLEPRPNIPLIAFGKAVSFIVGGQEPKVATPNRSYELYDRVCAFTYSYDWYLDNGRDKYVLKNIESTIKAALKPIERVDYIENQLPKTNKWVIDVECLNTEMPWLGNNKIIQIGIKDINGGSYAIVPSENMAKSIASLANNVVVVSGHNILFDLVQLGYLGIHFPKAKVHDTMIYHKNAFPNEPFYGLKYLARQHHGFPHWGAWFASKHKNHEPVNVDDAEEWSKLCNYNAYDLLATEALYKSQSKHMVQFYVEMDYLKYVLRMIQNGMYVDRDKRDAMVLEYQPKLDAAIAELRTEYGIGEDFNFGSPKQVLSFLQKYVPKIKSTNVEELVEHEKEHPFISKLLEVRDLSKLIGTGLGNEEKGLKSHIDPNGLVHSSYAVHGAETGRSSSSEPNMQNTDPRIRPLFISRYRGGKLVYTDLSGIEYRLIAHASEDRVLLDVFNSGKDIHDEMYFALFNEYPPNKERRKKAKTANFCGVYGGGYRKFLLSAELPDSPESKRLFRVVSDRYPGVAKWKERVIRDLYKTLRVRNLFGRVRTFDYVDQDIEREAINWIIQSSGHDILKIYSMEMCDMIAEAGCERSLLVSEVHDSNTFDCPADEARQVHDIIAPLAGNLNPLIEAVYGVKMKVPIVADLEILERWA